MATLRYNGVPIDVLPQQGARTLNVVERAIFSDDGIDYQWHQVIIEVQGIVNPQVIAVTPGATAGNTLWALQDRLKQPRKELTFDISNDRVIQAPPRLLANGSQVTMTAIANALAAGVALPGTLAASDCDGGPFPEELKIIEVQGTHSALIYFRVRCTINLCNNVVLTNRWSIRHSIDELHYTTRTISGTMTLRRDLGDFLTIKPDDFRGSVVIPCPPNLQREHVDVHQGSDAYTLEYNVTDRETPLASGPRFPGIRIEGNTTSGYETDIKGFIHDTLKSIPDLPGNLLSASLTLSSFKDFVKSGVRALIPIPLANGIVRVYGNKNSSRYDLAGIALSVLVDRFTNPGAAAGAALGRFTTLLSFMSCYLTADVIQQMVEVRAELIPRPINWTAFLSVAPAAVVVEGGLMNLSRRVNLGDGYAGVTLLTDAGGDNAQLPASNQTVGTYVGAMLAQAFQEECQPPTQPPDEEARVDLDTALA